VHVVFTREGKMEKHPEEDLVTEGTHTSLMADIIKDKFRRGTHRKGFQRSSREQGVMLHVQ
jgi:hypothetical protein